jgi:hypothetical protein
LGQLANPCPLWGQGKLPPFRGYNKAWPFGSGFLQNADGDVKKADEAEKLVMEELRKMGNEALHDWALNREEKEVEVIRKNKGLKNNGKKK